MVVRARLCFVVPLGPCLISFSVSYILFGHPHWSPLSILSLVRNTSDTRITRTTFIIGKRYNDRVDTRFVPVHNQFGSVSLRHRQLYPISDVVAKLEA